VKNAMSQMKTNDELREFLHRHSVRVLDTNKRAARHNGYDVQLFKYAHDYNMFNNVHIGFETEPLYTVEISESEIKRLATFEKQVFNNLEQRGHYNLFETLMEQKDKERFLKDRYPAVKKAYEHYSLMLKLAESGEIGN